MGCTYNGIAAATTVGDDEIGGTMFRVIRMLAGAVDCPHRDAVDGVGIAIKVAVIALGGAVAAGKDVDGTEAGPSILDTVQHRLADEDPWGLHVAAVIGGAPGARVDVVQLIFVDQGLGFVRVGELPAEDADARNLGVIGDAHAADVVAHSCHFASTSGAVLVVRELGPGLGVVLVEVVRSLGEVIVAEIVAVHVEAVVNNGHRDVVAGYALLP